MELTLGCITGKTAEQSQHQEKVPGRGLEGQAPAPQDLSCAAPQEVLTPQHAAVTSVTA